jgi:hypothetical protein
MRVGQTLAGLLNATLVRICTFFENNTLIPSITTLREMRE